MSDDRPQTFSDWLQLGQTLEASGRITDALTAYDRAITLLRSNPSARDIPDRRALAIGWMNRGNALQKLSPAAPLDDTLRAYDEAIALFESLPWETEPMFRNHLGAAWLNRGHALILANDPAAKDSFEKAVAVLEPLPLATDPYFRLNLAGAWTNLAHANLTSTPLRAIEAARSALTLLAEVEREHEAFAGMSLRARRALIMALGEQLHRDPQGMPPDFAATATDIIEDGLALARQFESRGHADLRPLAARLFQLGAQLYRIQQPHFLAEYLLETFALPAFAADPAFRAAAESALADALADTQRPEIFVAGTPDAARRREIAQSLRIAQARLSALHAQLPPSRT